MSLFGQNGKTFDWNWIFYHVKEFCCAFFFIIINEQLSYWLYFVNIDTYTSTRAGLCYQKRGKERQIETRQDEETRWWKIMHTKLESVPPDLSTWYAELKKTEITKCQWDCGQLHGAMHTKCAKHRHTHACMHARTHLHCSTQRKRRIMAIAIYHWMFFTTWTHSDLPFTLFSFSHAHISKHSRSLQQNCLEYVSRRQRRLRQRRGGGNNGKL